MSRHKLTSEEEALKSKLDELSFEYDANDWAAIEGQLKTSAKPTSKSNWLKTSLIVGTAALSSYLVIDNIGFEKKETQITSTAEETVILNEAKESIPLVKEDLKEAGSNEINQSNKNKKPEGENSETINNSEALTFGEEKSIEEIAELIDEIEETTEEESKVAANSQAISTLDTLTNYFFISEGKACQGNEVKLTVDSKAKDYPLESFYWLVNKKPIKNTKSISINVSEEMEYKVLLVIEQNNTLAYLDTSFKTKPNPSKIEFSYQEQEGFIEDFDIQLNALNTDESLTYHWDVEGKSYTGINPTHSFSKEGSYSVSLQATNEYGCTQSFQKMVSVSNAYGPFANAFTPNTDGTNESFMPHGFEDFNGEFTFEVYDMNNRVVYRSNSAYNAWNGKLNNSGELMPVGLYVWKIDLLNNKNERRTFKGQVRIKRFN